ncbi:MAG: branched-chain amino acid ABC transporter substrate-binding protein [Anaerolineae bacterium]|nr:branched-chain amino acid ABC transporter substrate-binding protein [Anaerolineae bacterium]
MRKALHLLILAAMCLMLVGTAAAQEEEDWGTVTVAAGDPVRIGFAAALSGAGVDVLGIDELRGAELAVADLNAEDGILGFTVELVPEDSMCSADGGATVANKFVSDESLVAIVGHMCSSACNAAKDIYAPAGYTMVSPSCTAVALTDPNAPSPVFNRTAWNDRVQAPAAAEFLYSVLGITSVATIHDGSPYGEGLVKAMEDAFFALGGDVIVDPETGEGWAINVGDTDMRATLQAIADAGPPGAIYFGGFPAEGAFLAQQRADAGMAEVVFMGADGINATAYVDAAGEAGCGSYASAANPASVEGGGYEAFVERYVEEYGEEPTAPFHAHAYDALMLIAAAVEEVGEVDADGNLTVDRLALRDAIRATEDFEGLTGALTCDEYGDCGSGADITVVEMMCPEDGEPGFEIVWPEATEGE